MTPEQAAVLRAPFPEATIGKLPRVWCRACTQANKQSFGTTCNDHKKTKCNVCKSNISEAHLHLDYVGHAATTDRLLQADPGWSWEPFALDGDGLPMIRGNNLWIRLTVCGVTRPGVGDGDTPKECIGDAIRNAAMRFGVALDLWSKEDLPHESPADGVPAPVAAVGEAAVPSAVASPPSDTIGYATLHVLKARVKALVAAKVPVADRRTARGLPPLNENCTVQDGEQWAQLLHELEQASR